MCVLQVACAVTVRTYYSRKLTEQICVWIVADPYVKIWMMYEGKKAEKKKTEVKEKTLNPTFNDSFTFDVPYERIRQTSLVVSVMDYDRMGRNEAIGQLILGSKSGPIEMKHWNEMFAKIRQPVTQWHILKDFDWSEWIHRATNEDQPPRQLHEIWPRSTTQSSSLTEMISLRAF